MNMVALAGVVAILNCSTGDTRISFNSNDPAEVERAKAVVEDMLKRGYCLAVVVGDKMERAVGFDPAKSEYIVESSVAPLPSLPPEGLPEPDGAKSKRGRRGSHLTRRSAKEHGVVAVGQTAGGGLGCRHFPLRKDAIAIGLARRTNT